MTVFGECKKLPAVTATLCGKNASGGRLPVSGKLMPTHTGFTVPNIKLAQASADAKVGEMVDDRTVGSGGGAQRLVPKAHDT
jgi:hypothetical protein